MNKKKIKKNHNHKTRYTNFCKVTSNKNSASKSTRHQHHGFVECGFVACKLPLSRYLALYQTGRAEIQVGGIKRLQNRYLEEQHNTGMYVLEWSKNSSNLNHLQRVVLIRINSAIDMAYGCPSFPYHNNYEITFS